MPCTSCAAPAPPCSRGRSIQSCNVRTTAMSPELFTCCDCWGVSLDPRGFWWWFWPGLSDVLSAPISDIWLWELWVKTLVARFLRQQSSCCRCMWMFITQNTVFRRSCLFVPTENDGPLHLRLAAAPSSYSQAPHRPFPSHRLSTFIPNFLLVDVGWYSSKVANTSYINPHVVGWHFQMFNFIGS